MCTLLSYNFNNSVKLITEDSIILSTNIGTWTDENNEIKSFLNTTFRNSLRNYTNFLTINSTNGWCTNSFSYSGDWGTAYYRVMQNYSCTTRDNENYVGIPDLSDMLGSANHSRDDSDVMSYLDNSRGYWTMTQLLQNSKLRTYYVTSGNSNYESTTDTTTYAGIRPVVNIKPTIKVIKGNGSKNNPYRLSGDNDSNTTKKLTTRYSGEYVKYSGYLWRIVNSSTSGTQLVMSKYLNSISNSKYKEANYIDIYEPYISSNNIITTLNDSSYGFLSTLKNYDTILDNKSWKWIEGDCTKLSLSNASGTSFTNYVGMLKYGDLFSGFETDNVYNSYYLLNRIYNNSNNDTICTIKYDNSRITPVKGYETISVRPSIYIKSNVYTKSGTGTLDEPFIIGE